MLAEKMLREATMSCELDGNVVRWRKRPMIIEGVALEVKKIVGCEDGIVVGFEFLGFGIPVGSNVLKDVCNCTFQTVKFV